MSDAKARLSRPAALWRVRRREVLARAGLGHLILDRYPYAFSPRQLATLTGLLDSCDQVEGIALEVGCAWAATTVFLQRHMTDRDRRRDYHCVDTFAGFTPADIEVERTRGKRYAYDDFAFNSERLFRLTLQVNGVDGATTVHQADVSAFDFATLPPVAFALVDVDLYRPVHAALEGTWEVLQPGGVVVVDDCGPNEKWDGAGAAFQAFCAERGLESEVVAGKLGVIRRPGGAELPA